MLRYPALGVIWAYQCWLSPRNGYRCAYGLLHGGTGCSGFAKHAIREAGFLRALPLIRARFAACAQAAREIAAQIREGEKDKGSGRLGETCSTVSRCVSCGGGSDSGAPGCGCSDFGLNGCSVPDCGCSGCGW